MKCRVLALAVVLSVAISSAAQAQSVCNGYWQLQPDQTYAWVEYCVITGQTRMYGIAPRWLNLNGDDMHFRNSTFSEREDGYSKTNCGAGDPRNDIIDEYIYYGVNRAPFCHAFSDSGGSANFSWDELNGYFAEGNPHRPWGIVLGRLTTGLEATRANYNRGGIRLSSGYRCPHGNWAVGGAAQSYHMHGRAADMKSSDHTWTEAEFNLLKTAAEATSPAPIESFNWNTYADRHYHAAW